MRIVKPAQLGLVYRTYVKIEGFRLAVGATQFFDFDDTRALLTEQQMWDFLAEELGPDAIFDAALPKVRGEVLANGKCFAPGGEPVRSLEPGIEIGQVAKKLAVFGDRHWVPTDYSDFIDRLRGTNWEPSEPEPFTEMHLGSKNAYGGEGFAFNPIGKGLLSEDEAPDPDGGSPVPNVEAPDELMEGPWAVPYPAGFGPLELDNPIRMDKYGTCDQKWTDEVFPADPADTDPTFHNVARIDQQIAGFWRGDERFTVRHLHPDDPVIEARLPGFRSRCFVNLTSAEGASEWSEVELVPETIWLFPNVKKGIVLSRGEVPIRTFLGLDVDDLLLAYEFMDGQKRQPADYRESLRMRDENDTALEGMATDADLQPPEGVPTDEFDVKGYLAELDAMIKAAEEDSDIQGPDIAALAVAAKALEQELARTIGLANAEVGKAGIDLNACLPPNEVDFAAIAEARGLEYDQALVDAEMKLSELEELAASIDDQTSPEMAAQVLQQALELGVDTARAQVAKTGRTIDQLADEAAKQAPPDPDEKLAQVKAELEQVSAEENFAQLDHSPPENLGFGVKCSGMPDPGGAPAAIDKVNALTKALEAAAEGAAPDLPDGAEAPGVELPGEPTPEPAVPEVTPPQGAPVDSAITAPEDDLLDALAPEDDLLGEEPAPEPGPPVAEVAEVEAGPPADVEPGAQSVEMETPVGGQDLTGADLSGQDLSGRNFQGAILAEANLAGADLSGLVFAGAILKGANLAQAKLAGADLAGADLTQANLAEADLSESDLTDAILTEADLTGATLAGATLRLELAHKVTAVGADFSKAALPEATFLECDLSQAVFAGADLSRGSFSTCDCSQTDFSGANLHRVSFTECRAAESKLTQANASKLVAALGTDFSGADFSGADGTDASLVRTVFRGARFTGATLDGADFSASDATGADFSRATITHGRFIYSDLTDARFEETNLMQGSLLGATLARTDFSRANLFAVEALFVQLDQAKLAGANVTRCKLARVARESS